MPVTAAVVLLPVNSVDISSSQLVGSGQQSVQGQTYQVYASPSLSPGSTLSMTLSGSPGAATSIASTSSSWVSIVIGGSVFLVALVLAGLFIFRKRKNPLEETGEEIPEAFEEDADSLIDAIAALDDLYKEGELPEAVYQKRREEMKLRLKKILQETGANLK